MTYKWKIEIVLNCGKEIVGRAELEHDNSLDVAKEILLGKRNDFYAIGSLDRKKHVVVRVCDVSSMAISLLEE